METARILHMTRWCLLCRIQDAVNSGLGILKSRTYINQFQDRACLNSLDYTRYSRVTEDAAPLRLQLVKYGV
jgi:hypothetical protein